MARNLDWLYETPKQESLRNRLWCEAEAKMVATKYRRTSSHRKLIKRESTAEIEMLLGCIKADKEKRSQEESTKARRVVIERHYLEAEYEREASNGRIYTGVLGWRWMPVLDGVPVGHPEGYKTHKEAFQVVVKAMNEMQVAK
jgi:hypothetical protein